MLKGLHVVAIFGANLFKSRERLEAENALLRHQLNIALRRAPARLRLTGTDRSILVWMVRLWPNLLNAVQVVKPDTVLRWHRAGFKAFGRWKSRKRAGRPKIDRDLRDLIRLARQITEDFPWASAPGYLVGDNDRAYGQVFTCPLRIFRPRLGSSSDVELGQHRRDADPAAHVRNLSVQSAQAATPACGRELFSAASTWDRHQASSEKAPLEQLRRRSDGLDDADSPGIARIGSGCEARNESAMAPGGLDGGSYRGKQGAPRILIIIPRTR